MAGGGDSKTIDVLALILSIISLCVSGFSVYLSEYRQADVRTTVGQKVLLNGKPRIGVLCTFTNAGSRQKVITSASLQWDGKATFDLEMTSPNLELWEIGDNEKLKIAERMRYATLVAPIAVKARDQSTAILWFTSKQDLAVTPGKHSCLLKIFSRSEELSSEQFHVEVTADDVAILKSSPVAEAPVKVVWEKQP